MNLLSPWFLAGLALVAGPVIAHLIRRATRDRVQFSAMRFLTSSAPRLDRRSRVQHPWLLALRCLIVALLAFAFARPYFQGDSPLASPSRPPRQVIAILDASASMQRDRLWAQAQQQVRELAAALEPEDDFTLVLAEERSREILSVETWRETPPGERNALLAATLAAHPSPGASVFHLDTAVEQAIERSRDLIAVTDAETIRTELHVVSDFAAGTRISGLAGLGWPSGLSVNLDAVDSPTGGNASLHWLGWSEDDDGAVARLRVSSDAGFRTASLQLQLRDAATGAALGDPQTVVIGRESNTTALLPVPATAPAALRIDLTGDDMPFDNTVWSVRPTERRLGVAILGAAERVTDPTAAEFYLHKAFAGWRDPVPVLRYELAASPAPDSSDGNVAPPPLIVVTRAPTAPEMAALRSQLERGAHVLLLADSAETVATLETLLGENDWLAADVSRRATRDNTILARIDFSHPLFAPFADPNYSDFTRIRFWSHLPLQPPPGSSVRVLAGFDDGSAAVLEADVGRGKLVVWNGAWTNRASQWVLSSKFVPWLQTLAERAAGGAVRPAVTELHLRPSAGREARLSPLTGEESIDARQPVAPGVYRLPQGTPPGRLLALNVPVVESDIASLDFDAFADLGVPLTVTQTPADFAEQTRRAEAEAAHLAEARQKNWRWLLLLVALLLIGESILSLRLAHRAPAPAPSAS